MPNIATMKKGPIIVGALAIVIVIIIIVVFMMMSGPELPDGFANGDVVRCASTTAIFKIEGGYRRVYPSMDIYIKHGRPTYRNVDCAVLNTIADGSPMA